MRNLIESRSIPEPNTGCWLWVASTQSRGYGDFRLKNKHYLAHRASYQAYKGDIPSGMHVCHKCDEPGCVNPDHLFLGTNQDNIADSVAKGRRKGITRSRPGGLTYKKSGRTCITCGSEFKATKKGLFCKPYCKTKHYRELKKCSFHAS